MPRWRRAMCRHRRRRRCPCRCARRSSNPRPYGYLVGDTLVQRVQLTVDGKPVELTELPRKDRYGVWIAAARRASSATADGTRWLAMEYQIINASKDVDVISLPKLKLRTTTRRCSSRSPTGRSPSARSPPAWCAIRAGLLPLQAGPAGADDRDQADPPSAEACADRPGGTLALWLGWWRWREWQPPKRLPFGRARRQLAFVDAAVGRGLAAAASGLRCQRRPRDPAGVAGRSCSSRKAGVRSGARRDRTLLCRIGGPLLRWPAGRRTACR